MLYCRSAVYLGTGESPSEESPADDAPAVSVTKLSTQDFQKPDTFSKFLSERLSKKDKVPRPTRTTSEVLELVYSDYLSTHMPDVFQFLEQLREGQQQHKEELQRAAHREKDLQRQLQEAQRQIEQFKGGLGTSA